MPGRAVVSGPEVCAIAAVLPQAMMAAVNSVESIFMLAILARLGCLSISMKCEDSGSRKRIAIPPAAAVESLITGKPSTARGSPLSYSTIFQYASLRTTLPSRNV
jgi:hypothetical protein